MFDTEAKQLSLSNEIAKLKELILLKHPTINTLLDSIHKCLQEQPENVTLLKEEEIGVICDGLKLQNNILFAQETTKQTKSQSSVKSLKNDIKNLGADAF